MEIGKPLIRLKSIDSTNAYAASLINRNEAMNGMVISAISQTAGKGQDRNQWESKPGENLTISIVVQPMGLPPAKQFYLNKITSLAVRDFVLMQPGHENVTIKWPNDIYIADKKVAGILISNTITGQLINWTVIGIGININQLAFESDAPNPVSLKQLSGKDYNLEACLTMLCNSMEKRLNQLFVKKYTSIDNEYINAMYRFGVFCQFVYKDRKIDARITGVGAYGHLELETMKGESLTCDLREIKLVI